MTLLGIDIGTTHLKAGLLSEEGEVLQIAAGPNPLQTTWGGIRSYDPQVLWAEVLALLADLRKWREAQRNPPEPVQAIGVASMAETGLLVDRGSGMARTPLIPWFETCALAQTESYRRTADLEQVFQRTGLHPAAKHSLMKLLWLEQNWPQHLPDSIWLSAADYVVFRLCGRYQTDFTLAERTCAFRVDNKEWDLSGLAALGLGEVGFPEVSISGASAGVVSPELRAFGIAPGATAAVAGHDHVCGAFAAVQLGRMPGHQNAPVFDSMGTAESLIGVFPERSLTQGDDRSGFAFGLSCAPGYLYWQGGLSTSGGSLDWLRGIFGQPAPSYAELEALLLTEGSEPTGILYFPYLAGSGSPHSDSHARGAFIGLDASDGRGRLYRAVLEGCAYETAFMRRIAQGVTGVPIERIVAAGGGTRNVSWMQIKADIYDCPVDVLEIAETTLYGAALLAGLRAGIIADASSLKAGTRGGAFRRYLPHPEHSQRYRTIFEEGYLKYEREIRRFRRD